MQSVPAGRFFQVSLLLLVATGYAAVVATGRLDTTTAALAGAALAARALLVVGWLRLRLSRGAVLALTIAYIGFYPLDYLYLSRSFPDATVRLVFFLSAIKVLTAQTRRDYTFVGVIALLQMLSAAMLTDSASFFGFLAVFVLFAVAARTSYEIGARGEKAVQQGLSRPLTRRLAALGAVLAVATVLLGMALFFVVPRAAGAYLAALPPSGESTAGFAEHIRLDATGRIGVAGTPVMHVRLLEGLPGVNLKWRGGALAHFDGIRWSNATPPGQVLFHPQGQYTVAPFQQHVRTGPRIRYRVLRAAMETDALFFAGVPEMVSGRFYRLEVDATDSISAPGTRGKAVRYEAVSYIGPERPAELRDRSGLYLGPIRSTYLQLPALDPRVADLAHHLTESQVTPYWRAAALEHYLQTELGYTLELPAQAPADPLADFLFQRKKGHCEYFASAMTVMLRAIGIPARVAIGFQGGEYNPVSGYYTIRSSDAHSWVEAYFPEFGWAPFDPTPEGPQVTAAAPGPLARLGWYLDALETYWQDWIVQYDLGRQLQLGRSVRGYWLQTSMRAADAVNWDRKQRWMERQWRSLREKPAERLALGFAAAIGLILAAWLVVWSWPLLRARIEAWQAARRIGSGALGGRDCAILYSRALDQLRRRGFPRPTSQTPHEFAAALTGVPPSRAAGLQELTALYNCARFGGDTNAARQLPEMLRQWERLPWRQR